MVVTLRKETRYCSSTPALFPKPGISQTKDVDNNGLSELILMPIIRLLESDISCGENIVCHWP